jgi:hypothetical protein
MEITLLRHLPFRTVLARPRIRGRQVKPSSWTLPSLKAVRRAAPFLTEAIELSLTTMPQGFMKTTLVRHLPFRTGSDVSRSPQDKRGGAGRPISVASRLATIPAGMASSATRYESKLRQLRADGSKILRENEL